MRFRGHGKVPQAWRNPVSGTSSATPNRAPQRLMKRMGQVHRRFENEGLTRKPKTFRSGVPFSRGKVVVEGLRHHFPLPADLGEGHVVGVLQMIASEGFHFAHCDFPGDVEHG